MHSVNGERRPPAVNPDKPTLPAVTGSGKAKAGVIVLMCLTSCFALAWGSALARVARGVILDFKIVYFGARCIVQHHDPYNLSDLLRVYLAEGGEQAPQTAQGYRAQMIVGAQFYPPSAELLIAPFGLLPWPAAYALWTLLTVAGITAAAGLMWSVASRFEGGVAFYLISFILINSGTLFAGGNTAGVAVSLCVIAAWCFVRNRHLNLGIVCMAISLAIKPHDSGLVWLYFLLAGAVMRKSALRSLLVVAIIGIIAMVWIRQFSPHWLAELQQNLHEYTIPGAFNDPGPVATRTIGPGMIIDLETVTSVIRDEAGFYRVTAYLLCAPFLALWAFLTIRSRFSETRGWFGLATIAPLTMLPVYHRPYDAKLLLLTIPACAMLWSAGRVHAWLSLALTGTAIVFTSDLPLALLSAITKGAHFPTDAGGQVITILFMRPAPLALLALTAFNLFQYAKICRTGAEDQETATPPLVPIVANQT